MILIFDLKVKITYASIFGPNSRRKKEHNSPQLDMSALPAPHQRVSHSVNPGLKLSHSGFVADICPMIPLLSHSLSRLLTPLLAI